MFNITNIFLSLQVRLLKIKHLRKIVWYICTRRLSVTY